MSESFLLKSKSRILSVMGSSKELFSGQLPFSENTSSTSLESSSKDSAVELSENDDRLFQGRLSSNSDNTGDSSSNLSTLSNMQTEDEEEIENFMRNFIDMLFTNPMSITLHQKFQFGQYSQIDYGRSCFARLINSQRSQIQCVSESTFYSLVQYFALVLFECAEADHFPPAKTLMNMCFTFYHEVAVPGCEPFKEYLTTYLMDQPIWRSLRFWNAAFFDALQCERLLRPVATAEDIRINPEEAIADEKQYQQNITFGQLGTFSCNMHAFGLNKQLCTEFLRKQCSIASLTKEQIIMLYENVERMYAETDPWR